MTSAGTRAPAHHILQSGRHALDEAVLLQVMPVGLLHAAAAMRSRALKAASGPVGTLLVGRRIFLGEDALDLQIGELLVAVIAQEKRLAAVADEHQGVMGDGELGHMKLPNDRARRRRRLQSAHHRRQP